MKYQKIPEKLSKSLSSYGPKIFNSTNGKPIGWGYKILEHLGEEKFNELQKYGETKCIYPHWFLITKQTTKK